MITSRFCSTLSWWRNRTNVASEARPRLSTFSWYVNNVNSGIATALDVAEFFFHLGRFVVRRDPRDLTFSIWEHGDGKRTCFFVWMNVLRCTRCFMGFHVKPKRIYVSQNLTKTWHSAWRKPLNEVKKEQLRDKVSNAFWYSTKGGRKEAEFSHWFPCLAYWLSLSLSLPLSPPSSSSSSSSLSLTEC